jgi:hypothetical protein
MIGRERQTGLDWNRLVEGEALVKCESPHFRLIKMIEHILRIPHVFHNVFGSRFNHQVVAVATEFVKRAKQ